MDKPKKISRKKQLALEGRCPECGEWCFPYYQCSHHRMFKNIYRVLRKFEKAGWVDVTRDPKDNKKIYKWNNTAPKETRKYSPETIAKYNLPRLNGKPMTEDVLKEAILKILGDIGYPMYMEEIEKQFQNLKTLGKVIPETDELIAEYKLIQQKKSQLSRGKRDAVNFRIKFLMQRGVVNETQISLP